MRVALVGPELEENLGIRSIAAALGRAGVQTDIHPFDVARDLPGVCARLVADAPDVVGLSLSFQWRALDVFALAVALREAGWRGLLVGGGHFAAFTWQHILTEFPEFDALCLYEAEETMVALVSAWAANTPLRAVPGLALRSPEEGSPPFVTPPAPPPDLATLPWPDRRGEALTCLGHKVHAVVASRGCYAHCAFCCIAAWHGRGEAALPFRVRPVEDVADELAWLHHERGAEIFIFHDDDFFVPGGRGGVVGRLHALADALDARGVGRVATVVKARPNDVRPEVLRLARDRLGLVRVFLGVETDAVQGLRTLDRRVQVGRNEAALATLAELGLYTCFNLLAFDPDTTVDDLLVNVAFMERHADVPFNFGRAELYAGTPLLARMQAEGRTRGDWLAWDYQLHDDTIQEVFTLAMRLFRPRNFAGDALANRLQGTRFDVEVARHFHPDRFDGEWDDEIRALHVGLGRDTAAGLREVVTHVTGDRVSPTWEADLAGRLRDTEARLRRRASALEASIRAAVGARCHHYRPRAAPGAYP